MEVSRRPLALVETATISFECAVFTASSNAQVPFATFSLLPRKMRLVAALTGGCAAYGHPARFALTLFCSIAIVGLHFSFL
jgi:hypothetical protein